MLMSPKSRLLLKTNARELKFCGQVGMGQCMFHANFGDHWCLFVALRAKMVKSAILNFFENFFFKHNIGT